jgi:hypothetical protein
VSNRPANRGRIGLATHFTAQLQRFDAADVRRSPHRAQHRPLLAPQEYAHDPLAYGVDGLRGAFIGVSQIGLLVDVAVLAVLSLVFLLLGARAFSKIQV